MASLLYVTPWLQDGGIERALETEAPWLARRGHRVDVASWFISDQLSAHPNPVLDTLARSGIHVRRVRSIGRLHLVQRALLVAARALRDRADVVIGQEMLGGVVAMLAARLTGRLRGVVEVHCSSEMYTETVKSRATLALARRLYRRADGVRAVSDSVALDAVHFFALTPGKVATIYNTFDLEHVREMAAEPVAAAIPRAQYVVACGRLVKMKSFSDVIDAVAAIRATRRLKLIILGDGPDRDLLLAWARQRGIADDVILPGFVPNPFPYFAGAAAVVMASRYGESFSRVLVEAMACNTPVISSRCPGPEEVLAGGKYGRLYEVGDVAMLTEHLRELFERPEETAGLVTEARRRAEDFSMDRVLPELERFYLG